MTNVYAGSRKIGQTIKDTVEARLGIQWGVIKKVSRKGKSVKVTLLPEAKSIDDESVWIEYIFPFAAKDSQVGGMPPIGTKVMVIFLDHSEDNPYENAFAFGGLFDKKTNTYPVSPSSDGDDDSYHYWIKPPHGGGIEFYKTSGDKHKIVLTATDDYAVNVTGDDIETINGKQAVICNDINLGANNLDSDHAVVLKKFVNDKYNAMVEQLNSILMQLFTTPFIGDMGLPMPLAVRSTGAFTQYTTWAAQEPLSYKDTFLGGTISNSTKASG